MVMSKNTVVTAQSVVILGLILLLVFHSNIDMSSKLSKMQGYYSQQQSSTVSISSSKQEVDVVDSSSIDAEESNGIAAEAEQVDVSDYQENKIDDRAIIPSGSSMLRANAVTFSPTTFMSQFDDILPEGFAQKPQTLGDMNICDLEFNMNLKGSFVCPKDKTCAGCYTKTMSKTASLVKEYNPKLQAVELDSWLSKTNRVMVMAVNFGQSDYLLNWYISVLRNTKINPCNFTFVVATDQKAYKKLVQKTCLKVFFPNLDFKISEKFVGANIGPHADINNVIFMTVEHFISKNKIVLMQDVDMVWFKDVFPYLEKRSKGIDSLCMVSRYWWDSRSWCNTGFLYINPTAKSKILWKTLLNAMHVKITSDQTLYNTVVRLKHFQMYHYLTLPTELFCLSGSTTTHFKPGKTLLYHALSSGKEEKYKKVDGWYIHSDKNLLQNNPEPPDIV